jgi:hypothetical protein
MARKKSKKLTPADPLSEISGREGFEVDPGQGLGLGPPRLEEAPVLTPADEAALNRAWAKAAKFVWSSPDEVTIISGPGPGFGETLVRDQPKDKPKRP